VRWLPDALVLLLVAAAVAQQQTGFVDHLLPRVRPVAVQPAGMSFPAQAAPGPVADSAAPPSSARIDTAALAAALKPFVTNRVVGPHLVVEVVDLDSGATVFRHGGPTLTPASTMKLLTTTAALDVLGPFARFRTRVVRSGDLVTLVGGGDPFLMSSARAAAGLYPERADLGTLAAATARALRAAGLTSVRLAYDASLFSGPRVSPDWPASYVSGDVVPPITALWADEGRDRAGQYVADPAAAAAATFGAALRHDGLRVRGAVVSSRAARTAAPVAEVSSAPLGEIVEQTLALSDNNAAEVLGHQVGLAVAQDGSYAGGARAVKTVLGRLGVPLAGTRILDGSGLSRRDLLTADTLLGVLELATSDAHPSLRWVVTGLPVAGFTGSLRWRFDQGPAVAKGRVRAKTGTLTGVHGLAGIAVDLDGDRLLFVAVADRVPGLQDLAARADVDRIAAALGACHCRSVIAPTTAPATP
jgi:D-alanyl-D-alanine carboxypeptidase/D-alanyl-D-alanine-endopeptidase (penicillin-binding protein 4)